MSNLKLGVDVAGAHNLLPKDGRDSSSAFVELSFDGLKQRTTVKENQLNPVWNESFSFNISDVSDLQYLTLDAYVYSRVKATSSKSGSRTRSFLGKISLPASSFVHDCSDAVVLHYRLEKHHTFSRVSGDLGLKVYIIGDSSVMFSTPIAAADSHANANMDTTPALEGIQGDSNPLSPKEVGTSLTFPLNQSHDQGVNTASTSSTAIAEVESLAVPNGKTAIASGRSQGSSNPLTLISSKTSNAEVGTRLTTFHHDHGDKTASTSSIPFAAVESLTADLVTNPALRSLGDSSPPVVIDSSTDPNAEFGTGHTSSSHGDIGIEPSKSSPVPEVRSLAIAHKDTIVDRAWTQGGSNPPTANVEAGVGTRHTFIHRPITSQDHGDKKAGNSVSVGLMHFIYVRIVKARDLPTNDLTDNVSPFVEATIGNYKGITKRHFNKERNPVWDEVFSFSRDRVQASVLQVVVKDKDQDCVMGSLYFDLHEIPLSPPESDTASSLAPQWYRLQDKIGNTLPSELMLSVWMGTQTDEAFSHAWNSDAASVVDSAPLTSTVLGPNVYFGPMLWYVRVNVIEVEDLQFASENRLPEAYVKVSIGNQVVKTKTIQSRKRTLFLSEDLWFVTAEPFENPVVVAFMDHGGPDNEEVIGSCLISLHHVNRRLDSLPVTNRWYNLSEHNDMSKEKLSGRIHVRVCLEAGYCVSYGSTLYRSDLRPTGKKLWKPAIGFVELGIMDAEGLKTCDGTGTAAPDSYCVAKYGHKWVRTRIHFDKICPKYNETHSWEVYDRATVLTVCVFHCNQLGQQNNPNRGKDLEMGKIRIHISTLEAGRRYTQSYPLLVVQPNGVNKLGELNLTIQFSCISLLNMLSMYSQPVMPKMQYLQPIPVKQLQMLNAEAIKLIAERFSRAEPPLRKEVVEYISDEDSHLWSMRRSKANFYRVTTVLSGLFYVAGWLRDIYMWKSPIMTVLAHALFLLLVCSPGLILPSAFFYMFLTGIWNFCFRPRDRPLSDTKLTQAGVNDPDELEEELDTYPTSQSQDVVMRRYDRLRSIAGRIQSVCGDVASAGERIQMLLSWRDSSATFLFVTFCLVVAIVLYVTPFQVIVGSAWFVVMIPGSFRYRLPSVLEPLVNFFRRLPDKTDILL